MFLARGGKRVSVMPAPSRCRSRVRGATTMPAAVACLCRLFGIVTLSVLSMHVLSLRAQHQFSHQCLLSKLIASLVLLTCHPLPSHACSSWFSSSWPFLTLLLFCPNLYFARLNLRASLCHPGTATPAPLSSDGH